MLGFTQTQIKFLLRSAVLMACAFVLPATVHGADDEPNYYLPKPDCEYLTEAAKQEDLHGHIKYRASQEKFVLNPRYDAVPEMKQFCEEFLEDVLAWKNIKIVEPVQRAETLQDATFVKELEAQCPDLEISTATYQMPNIHTRGGTDPFHVRFLFNYKLYDVGTDDAGDKIVAVYMDYKKPYQNNMNNFAPWTKSPHGARYLLINRDKCQILGTYGVDTNVCGVEKKSLQTLLTAMIHYKGRDMVLFPHSNSLFLKDTRETSPELSKLLKIGPKANSICGFSNLPYIIRRWGYN